MPRYNEHILLRLILGKRTFAGKQHTHLKTTFKKVIQMVSIGAFGMVVTHELRTEGCMNEPTDEWMCLKNVAIKFI